MKETSSYDKVLKEIVQQERPSGLLDFLTGGVGIRQILNADLPRSIERRADSVFLLEDESILHVEFQTKNDSEMPYREGIYCLLLGQKHRRRVRQVVIYLGEEKMRMARELDLGQTKVSYTLIDIRDLDAEMFLNSGRAADLPLAVLARGGAERMVAILRKAVGLTGVERENTLSQLVRLSGLRRMQDDLIMELNEMLNPSDPFLKITLVREMVEDASRKAALNADLNARIQMLRDQMKTKFRTLPKWADERLKSATALQVRRWSRKFAVADSIEAVIGKK